MGIFGFYLFDSAMLLYANELVFAQSGRGWAFTYPDSNWRLLRKNLYLPNPFTPQVALFRVYWIDSDRDFENKSFKALGNITHHLKPIRIWILMLFTLEIVAFPVVLFSMGNGTILLLILIAVYFVICVALALTFNRRVELGLSIRRFTGLAFESLMCAPNALNLIRKISLNSSPDGDPILFAREVFERDAFSSLIETVCLRIDEKQIAVGLESSAHSSLENYRNRLRAMLT